MTVTVVCPGSYDPMTNGHLDVIVRAARRFDRVIVAVVANPSKQPLFTLEERVGLITAEVDRLVAAGDIDAGSIDVAHFDGLLVDFCRQQQVGIVCKGLRGVGDFDAELQMAQMNARIGDIETIFVATRPDHSYLSSSLIREIARLDGPVTGMVPAAVERALIERVRGT